MMVVRYDNKSRTTHDNEGVEIRVPGWGKPKYVEYLDSAEDTTGLYFGNIADKLVKTGYVRGRNLFGAPYDFRKAASKTFEKAYSQRSQFMNPLQMN